MPRLVNVEKAPLESRPFLNCPSQGEQRPKPRGPWSAESPINSGAGAWGRVHVRARGGALLEGGGMSGRRCTAMAEGGAGRGGGMGRGSRSDVGGRAGGGGQARGMNVVMRSHAGPLREAQSHLMWGVGFLQDRLAKPRLPRETLAPSET